jgi:hypothetical protein
MAHKTTTGLNPAGALGDTDLFAITQGGNSRKATLAQLKTAIQSGLATDAEIATLIADYYTAAEVDAIIAGLGGGGGSFNEATLSEMFAGVATTTGVTPRRFLEAASPVIVSYTANLALDGNTGFNFQITQTGNLTLTTPTNMKDGQSGVIQIIQDATGGRTITFGSTWNHISGVLPDIDSNGGAANLFGYFVDADGEIWLSFLSGSGGGTGNASEFMGARIKKAGTQSGANYSAGGVIAWDSEDYDIGGFHDTVTNNSRFVIPAGVTRVDIGWSLVLAGVTAGSVSHGWIRKNGVEIGGGDGGEAGGNVISPRFGNSTGPISVVEGDYLDLWFQTTDVSIDIDAASSMWLRVVENTDATLELGQIEVETVTGTAYTLVLADAARHKRFTSASAITLTIPPNASVAFPIGTRIRGTAAGVGQVTLAPGAGVTLNSRDSALKSAGRYAVFEVEKVATNEWDCLGDLTV